MQKNAQHYIMRAIEIAKLGHGHAEPNPMVGCVIVNDSGEIVSEGYHECYGEAHAEVNALKMAGEQAKGATAFVTLEPCNHEGKTPPCAVALIKAGIRKVVIGSIDPHQLSTGGVKTLQDAGIEVEILDDNDCNKLLAPFTKRVTTGLPWVICKWAQTTDGSTITPEGDSPWISCEESISRVHEERGCVDGILVGANTVIQDNPTLTARGQSPPRMPIRIVLDPTLRSPVNANVFNDDATTVLVHESLQDASSYPCETIPADMTNGLIDLETILGTLADTYDITNLIVEGGAVTITRFLDASLVDELWVFKSPNESNCRSYINMNDLIARHSAECVVERPSGVDTELRYSVKF